MGNFQMCLKSVRQTKFLLIIINTFVTHVTNLFKREKCQHRPKTTTLILMKGFSLQKYVAQMVRKSVVGRNYPDQCGLIVDLLHRSQGYMRKRKDECSFVSLRDVERTLIVLTWFLDDNRAQILREVYERIDNEDNDENFFKMSAILALGVTFYARLEKRDEYVNMASQWLKVTPEYFCSVIKHCQGVFIDEVSKK